MDVNKLAIKAYYENNKENYYRRRDSGDSSQWNEQYKWEIFPKLNSEFSKIDKLTADNALDIIKVLVKEQPQHGPFSHWTGLDTLRSKLEDKPLMAKGLAYAWHPSPDNIGTELDAVNDLLHSFFSGSFRIDAATFGYFLAAQDCTNFAPYKSNVLKAAEEINMLENTKTTGEKYQLVNDTYRYLGELMQADRDDDAYKYTALNGQDFLYVNVVYK